MITKRIGRHEVLLPVVLLIIIITITKFVTTVFGESNLSNESQV